MNPTVNNSGTVKENCQKMDKEPDAIDNSDNSDSRGSCDEMSKNKPVISGSDKKIECGDENSEDVNEKNSENSDVKNSYDLDVIPSVKKYKNERKRKSIDRASNNTDETINSKAKSDNGSSLHSLDSDVPNKTNNSGNRVSGEENLTDNPEDSSRSPVKQKRGRKKTSSESAEMNVSETKNKENSAYLGMPFTHTSTAVRNAMMKIKSEPIDETLHMSCDEMDVSTDLNKIGCDVLQVKRGRGRPRKTTSVIPSDKKSVERVLDDRRRRRTTVKMADDDQKSASSSSSSGYHRGAVKRGRGRPRKTDSPFTPVISSSVSLSGRRLNLSGQYSGVSERRLVDSVTKRRIIKPKRFDSYESFDFMDVNSKSKLSPNNASLEDHDDEYDEHSDALQIVEEEDDSAQAESDGKEREAKFHDNRAGGDNKSKQRKSKIKTQKKQMLNRSSVTCGVCHKQMTQNEYNMRHMDKHNFVCWLEGEKALDPTSETDIIGIYCKLNRIRKKNFSGMKCQKCGVKKKSGVGYFSHIQQCGMTLGEREAMKVPCPICGRIMLPCSLKVHMGQEHKSPGSKEPPPKREDEIIPLSKRQAAKRAESKLEVVLADELKEDHVSTKKMLTLKRFYRQTQSKLFPNAYVRWRLELAEKKVVKCFVPGCSYTADNLKSMQLHFHQCPYAIRVFICKVCNAKMKFESDIQKHIMSEHKGCLTGDSDFQVKVGNSDNDDDADDVCEDVGKNPSGSRLVFDKPNFIIEAVRNKGLTFFTDIIDKNYKRYIEITPSEPLFQEFIAPFDDILSKEDAEKHLPATTESIHFSSEGANWRKLGRFEACTYNGTKLLFVGGPVWALAWCPLPLEETRQFLAVACHPSMNMIHDQGTIHCYDSLIQIWDCGEFENLKPIDDRSIPVFKLGLAHSHGAVWSLEWCPNGCYQPSGGRLGLLAAGFSDGTVSVYSVSSRPFNFDSLPIVESTPVLELELVNEEPAQCTRLAWCKMPPFNYIACGYSDGLIAVFDLATQSPLLRVGNKLNPCIMIQAHVKPITGLHFLPKQGNNYVLSASADRDIKFWNLQDTSGPVSVSQLYRMITVTDITWFNHWLCAASTYDDALGYGLVNVALNGYRDFMFGQPYPVMSQNSLHWSISANDWTNGVVTSSDAGELTLLHTKQLFWLDEKSSKRSKVYLTTTDLRKLDGCGNTDPNTKLKVPESYEEASEMYGLVLKTKKYETCPSSRREDVQRNFYQIRSINKVAWNQNARSFLYLAAGYHAGFVQIFRDSNIDHAKVVFENFYKKLNQENS